MANLCDQDEELFSVESIFNLYEKNFIVENKIPRCGYFKANVWLPAEFCITYNIESAQNSDKAKEFNNSKAVNIETFKISHLPPINLFFELPDSYPSDTCPAFLLTCNWLTRKQLSILCKHLESMWDKGVQVLYMWCQFLESELIEFLNLEESLDITELLKYKVRVSFRKNQEKEIFSHEKEENNVSDQQVSDSSCSNQEPKEAFPVIKLSISGGCGALDCRAFNDLNDGSSLIQTLKNYNDFKITEVFNRKHHECDICLTTKLGSEFLLFKLCNHAFCKECLKGFFEVQIQEGNVNFLTCPYDKCNSQADNSMIQQVVDKKIFERYDSILLSRTLENMSDVMYCPRKWCQCAVLIDSEGRMGSCPSCSFVFCPFCKVAYHGIAPCDFKNEQKQQIYEQYVEGTDEDRELLEKRHGKRAIKILIEDTLSESWKSSNSKNCPECGVNIEKTDGCNKMTCFRCGIFFCWVCMVALKSSNPYDHFSRSNGRCDLFPEDEINDFELDEFGPGEFLHFL